MGVSFASFNDLHSSVKRERAIADQASGKIEKVKAENKFLAELSPASQKIFAQFGPGKMGYLPGA
jgi:hypothetical protein